MHFLLGGIGGIASQVPEVLYAGDVDVAGGNLYPVFVGEYKCVVVSLCRVTSVLSFGCAIRLYRGFFSSVSENSFIWADSRQ